MTLSMTLYDSLPLRLLNECREVMACSSRRDQGIA